MFGAVTVSWGPKAEWEQARANLEALVQKARQLKIMSPALEAEVRAYDVRMAQWNTSAEGWTPKIEGQVAFDTASMTFTANNIRNAIAAAEAQAVSGQASGGYYMSSGGGEGPSGESYRLVTAETVDVASPATKAEVKATGAVTALTTPRPGKVATSLDWSELLKLLQSAMVGYGDAQKKAAAAQLMAMQQKGQPIYLDKPTEQAVKASYWPYVVIGLALLGGVLLLTMNGGSSRAPAAAPAPAPAPLPAPAK